MTDKTSTAPVMSLQQVRDALHEAHNSPGFEAVLDSCVAAIDAHLNAPTPDVVGGDVVAFRFVRADGHKYTWVDASEMDRNGRPEDVLAEGERIEYAYAAPRVQGDADHSVDLRQELKYMVRAYVRLLEVGRDRIVDLGGSCDPLDVMEQGDPNLIRAKRVLAAQPKGNVSHPAEQTSGDGVAAIPSSFLISKKALEGIHYMCGGDEDGDEIDDRWCEGMAWIGHLENGDGTSTYGLHLHNADYPEEGSITIAQFVERDAPRQAVTDGWQIVPPWTNWAMRKAMRDALPGVPGDSVDHALMLALAAAPSAGRMGVE